MITATLTLAGETRVIGQAWALLDRAEELTWGQPCDAIAGAAQALRDSLELAGEMTGLGWDASPSLAGCADGVEQDISEQMAALTAAVREHIGDKAVERAAGRGEQ